MSKTPGNMDNLLAARAQTHGDFTRNAVVAQELREYWRKSDNWRKLTATQREALDMLACKLARILTGNAHHADHWKDGAGYLLRVLDELEFSA